MNNKQDFHISITTEELVTVEIRTGFNLHGFYTDNPDKLSELQGYIRGLIKAQLHEKNKTHPQTQKD